MDLGTFVEIASNPFPPPLEKPIEKTGWVHPKVKELLRDGEKMLPAAKLLPEKKVYPRKQYSFLYE